MNDTPTPGSADPGEVPGLALTLEGPDGEDMEIAVPIRPPADIESVMSLIEAIDDFMADEDPPAPDAVTAALLLALGNHLRQAPQWPLPLRLDAFVRHVQAMVDDIKSHLDPA